MSVLRPPTNAGMRVLDRSKFTVTVPLLMARLNPRYIGQIGRDARPGELLEVRNISRVIAIPNESHPGKKGLLFAPEITQPMSQLSSDILQTLKEADADYDTYHLELTYDHWTADEILESIFPNENPPTGFSIVGHIAHMNLRDHFLRYKFLIGEVILDKNARAGVRTVVNKLDSIDTKFRTFAMEVIAGAPDFEVEQHEAGCRFQFDFREVYWNSRLHSEHERIVAMLKPGEALCDPMAGVGPFSIPAGRRHVFTTANDLNPASYRSLARNVELNKTPLFVKSFNEDGRNFIRSSLTTLREQWKNGVVRVPQRQKRGQAPQFAEMVVPRWYSNFVMNLPASAIEFLDAFIGLYKDEPEDAPLPTIHVYGFHKWDPHGPEPTNADIHMALAKRISRALSYDVDVEKLQFHNVRRVAPTKDMYCISFILPRDVAYKHS